MQGKLDRAEFPAMLILFKFGAPEHLRVFREQGLLHMKTLRYFASRKRMLHARTDLREHPTSFSLGTLANSSWSIHL